MPLELQYYNGVGFVTNAADGCTTLNRSDAQFANFQKNLTSCETSLSTPPALVTFASGKASVLLAKPGTAGDGNAGSVDLTRELVGCGSGQQLPEWG